MKVLVTGGRGFIGRYILRQLHELGIEVIAIRRPGVSGNQEYNSSNIKWLDCSLEDVDTLRLIFAQTRPDVCLHLAWVTKSGEYPSSLDNINLLNSSLALIRVAGEKGCARFVGVGTCAEYEQTVGPLHEQSRTHPHTLYGASKLALRYMGENLAEQYGVQFAWGRVFYVYGPHENRKRVVPAVINTLLDGEVFQASSGEQIRDYMHVQDVASAFVKICMSQEEGVFNVSSAEPNSLRQLLVTIGDLLQGSDSIRFGANKKSAFDPPYILGENTRLRSLGWEQQLALEEGLDQTIQWWRDERHRGTLSQECHRDNSQCKKKSA